MNSASKRWRREHVDDPDNRPPSSYPWICGSTVSSPLCMDNPAQSFT